MHILGSRIRIRPTRHEDLPFLRALWNDGAVMCGSGYPAGMHVSDVELEQWWQQMREDSPHHVIECLDGPLAGEFSVTLDAKHRARVDLKLATVYWGRGLATEALLLALRELFGTKSVTTILVEPSAANERAHRLLRRCGFHPAPTDNHPERWVCERTDFADSAVVRATEMA